MKKVNEFIQKVDKRILAAVFVLVLFAVVIILKPTAAVNISVTKCSSSTNQSASGYKLSSNYDIYSKDNIVSKVELKQVIETTSTETLNKFKTDLENQYSSNKSVYGGYTYSITESGNTLNVNVTIDYSELDMDKFVSNNVAMKQFLNDKNEFTLDGAKEMYSLSGATCE